MLQVIYPLGFIVSLSGLILWFYYQDNPQRSRLMSSAFLGGFMIYLFSLAFSDGTLSTKLWVLFRDLMVLGVVSQGFNFIRRNTILFFGALGLLYYVFYAFGFQRMSQSLTEAPSRLSTEANFYGELLVDMVEGKDLEQLDRVLAAYGATRYQRAFQPERADQTELDDYLVLDLPDTEVDRIADLEKDLLNSGLVDWVEENERIQLDPLEQVPSLRRGISYGINDPAVDQLWGFEAMKVNELYDLLRKQEVRPQRKALIAILDTGIDAAHEDLAANYKSIARKHDSDPQGHGTHCAGIAASVSNNKKGVASFSLQNDFVEVASVRVLGAYGGGTQQSIIKGIIEAADRGADVISMSLGGPSNRQRQRAYEQAIRYANKAGAIVVAAAGNS
ncbi:MAG: S8 family serine peptidase, partial [Bacteroidota bacterium]